MFIDSTIEQWLNFLLQPTYWEYDFSVKTETLNRIRYDKHVGSFLQRSKGNS